MAKEMRGRAGPVEHPRERQKGIDRIVDIGALLARRAAGNRLARRQREAQEDRRPPGSTAEFRALGQHRGSPLPLAQGVYQMGDV